MRKIFALMSLLCTASFAQAPQVLEARHPGGARFELSQEQGPCKEPARLASYTSPDGTYRVNGCYKLDPTGAVVGIAWLDGDASNVPLRVFAPKPSL